MPIYEYRCDTCGHLFDVFQRMTDDPVTACEKCGGPVQKVLHPVAIHFKGSGFYTTDYGRSSGQRPSSGPDSEGNKSDSDGKKSDTEGAKKTDTAVAGESGKRDGGAAKKATG